ncbi:MAG: hypothetical protein RLW62_06150 [Gammaproteobacteria bacterium]
MAARGHRDPGARGAPSSKPAVASAHPASRRRAVVLCALLLSAMSASAAPPARTLLGLPYYSYGAIENVATVLALPFLCFALLRHRRLEGWPYLLRAGRTTLVLLVAWEVAWNADVLFTSLRVAYLCKVHGGPRVYGTAEVEGFLGVTSIEHFAQKGYRYVERIESREPSKFVRLSLDNGEVVEKLVTEPLSRYQFAPSSRRYYGYAIHRAGPRVIDMGDSSVLGEIVHWEISPGLFDRLWLSLVPGSHRPWTCGDHAPREFGDFQEQLGIRPYPFDYLIDAVLKPTIQP